MKKIIYILINILFIHSVLLADTIPNSEFSGTISIEGFVDDTSGISDLDFGAKYSNIKRSFLIENRNSEKHNFKYSGDSVAYPIVNPSNTVAIEGIEQGQKDTNSKNVIQKDIASKSNPPVENPETILNTPEIDTLFSFANIFWSIVFIIITVIIIRLLTNFVSLLSERSTKHRITIRGFNPLIRIIGWCISIYIIVAGIFAPPASTILAISASIGVAVGFASQDILKNIFGGIILLIDRPFIVGDKIEVGKYYGEVQKIGLRSTRITTPDDSSVTIPNGEMLNQAVSNSNSGEANCQVVTEIFLPLNIDTQKARKIALELTKISKYVYLNKPITILFKNEFKERRSYLRMKIKAYVLDTRYEFIFQSEITENVIDEFIKQGMIDLNKTN